MVLAKGTFKGTFYYCHFLGFLPIFVPMKQKWVTPVIDILEKKYAYLFNQNLLIQVFGENLGDWSMYQTFL